MNLFHWRQGKDEELNAEIRSHLDEAIRVSDADAVGKEIIANGRRYTVIGVAPQDFL